MGIRKTRKKVLIKSRERTLEVFKKLEWYITLLDKFQRHQPDNEHQKAKIP